MKIFVTGASGFVGSTVAKDLLEHGYEVLGLARSEASAEKLKAMGAEVHYGDIKDVDSLKMAAEQVDGIVHTAFNHDFTRFQDSCNEDKRAIIAMGEVFKGSKKPFVITAAAGAAATGDWVKEEDRGENKNNPRIVSEIAADELSTNGINVSVVRLPPCVHGPGDKHGFVPTLINLARNQGQLAYVGDGSNCWAAVNRLDAAPVYRLAMEKNIIPGTRYHAVAESKIPLKDLTLVLSEKLQVPLVSLTVDEAKSYFAGFFHFACLNIPISSEKTQKDLGWHPSYSTLFEDIESNVYF